jgi:succinate dehydrogenase hydrophobic anchor subunit
MTSRKVAKRGFNLDYIMWLFMRLSALALYAVGLTGLTAALVMGARTQTDISTLIRWVFFPNPMHVFSSDIVNLDGFINQFWQIMQIIAVFFGVTHGLNGLRIVVEDFMGSTIWRTLWRGFIFFLWIFILLVAIYVVLAS